MELYHERAPSGLPVVSNVPSHKDGLIDKYRPVHAVWSYWFSLRRVIKSVRNRNKTGFEKYSVVHNALNRACRQYEVNVWELDPSIRNVRVSHDGERFRAMIALAEMGPEDRLDFYGVIFADSGRADEKAASKEWRAWLGLHPYADGNAPRHSTLEEAVSAAIVRMKALRVAAGEDVSK